MYFEKKIEQAESNAKCTWRVLNEIINKKQDVKAGVNLKNRAFSQKFSHVGFNFKP